MSVFHRVDVEEVEQMPARRYFLLAIRLPAYSGAVTARLAAAAPADVAPPAAAPVPDAAAALPPPDRTGVRTGPHPGSSWSFATAGGG
jgi:hypothetical protein